MKITLDLTDEDVVLLARLGRSIAGDDVAEKNARRAVVEMVLLAVGVVGGSRWDDLYIDPQHRKDRETIARIFPGEEWKLPPSGKARP